MLMEVSMSHAMRLYKDGEKVYCNGKQITPSWEYGSHASKDELFNRGVCAIIGYEADAKEAKYEADLKTPQRVKRISNGKFRVYYAWQERTHLEVRYAKKSDAQDFIYRRGGDLCWEDFDDRIDAQNFLTEKLGFIWW